MHRPTNVLKVSGIAQPVPLADMIKVEGYGNYSRLYIRTSPVPVIICQTLKWFDQQLPTFLRTSKSWLINPAWIRKSYCDEGRALRIELSDGSLIEVPRRRHVDILARLATEEIRP